MTRQGMPGSVLVAEDDEMVALVVGDICREMFLEVVVERSGEAALGLIAERHFDVLVTDFRMPGASGLELVRACRERGSGCRALLITGFASDEVLEAAAALGVRVLHKPFGATALRLALNEVLAE